MLAVALLLQAASTVGPVLPVGRCRPTKVGEVVVCARRSEGSPYRLKPASLPGASAPTDPLAFRLPGGGSGHVYPFQKSVSNATGQGIAVGASIPLGRRPRPAR